MDYNNLSTEQQLFCDTALSGQNVRVEACIGSGKTTAIQTLCDLFPKNKLILYLTYNKLLKIDAKNKIKNSNVIVTNYHGFVYPYLVRNNIRCGLSDSIRVFTENRLSIPRFDILIIDEYQDIELDFAEMLEYVKSTNPNMQIIMVGDMAQKIYDKTTLDVASWSDKFLEDHVELEFTQCFRLQPELAAKLGRIWEKNIVGVNTDCKVSVMGKSSVITYLKNKEPGDILCLGSKTGGMTDVLNTIEEKYPYKYNKKTVYARIKDEEANVEPSDNTAIFTTFDSSKGMEKPICIVFDWDEAYWATRCKQPGVNGDILRNIFCVAASRGKREIIFVQSVKHGKAIDLLSEETLMTPIENKELTDVYTDTMFDFKFVEEIAKAYEMIDMTKVDTIEKTIDINEKDGLIDLSPCIQEYQEVVFFKNYNIDAELDYAFRQKDRKTPDLSKLTTDQKLLQLVSLLTNQNRYYNQVRLPLVTPAQHNALINRLSERLDRNETVQVERTMSLGSMTVHGIADVIRDDAVWQIEYRSSLRPEDYLKAAMDSILFNRPHCVLWNTRNNEIYKVSVESKKRDMFLNQVYKIVTKQKTTTTTYSASTVIKHNFRIGEKVHHVKFGTGVITDIRKTLRQNILDVRFDNYGLKTIAEGYVEPA